MQDTTSEVDVTDEELCENCKQLGEELTKRKKQQTEQETTYEKAVGALEIRLKDERKKNDDLSR